MNTIYRSDLTNRVMISYLHNSAFSRKVSQSFVTNLFFYFCFKLTTCVTLLHVCFCFGLKSDCHIPLVFEACFLHLLRKCPVYVPGRYPTLTVTSVVALTASCQWMVDGSWTWSSEWVSERMGKERQHIRVSVIPMWENIDQSHVALFMRFLQIQMAQHRQSFSLQRKLTREFSCNKKCILIQKWKDEILAECRVLAVRTVNVSGSVCLTWCW